MRRVKPRWPTLEAAYATFALPLLLAWPVFWAVTRWRAWEAIAWLVAVAIGCACYVRTRDRERSSGAE